MQIITMYSYADNHNVLQCSLNFSEDSWRSSKQNEEPCNIVPRIKGSSAIDCSNPQPPIKWNPQYITVIMLWIK